MKRKAKKHIARRERPLTEAELKKVAAGFNMGAVVRFARAMESVRDTISYAGRAAVNPDTWRMQG